MALPLCHPAEEGNEKGIGPEALKAAGWEYVPWLIVVLCIGGTSVDTALFHALHTTIDTNEAFDLYDLQQISGSWKQAELMNIAQRQANGV